MYGARVKEIKKQNVLSLYWIHKYMKSGNTEHLKSRQKKNMQGALIG